MLPNPTMGSKWSTPYSHFFLTLVCILFMNVVVTVSEADGSGGGGSSSSSTVKIGNTLTNTASDSKPVTPSSLPNSSLYNTTGDDGHTNNTTSDTSDGFRVIQYFKDKKNGAILRAFSVVMGVTGIVVVYFIIRAVRLRRKRSKSRKYGIIAKSGDLEMTPLDQDDDDDDTTVFEAQNHLRK